MVKDVAPGDIETAIEETKILFVDCWAPWCGPCLALGPILDELEQKYTDNPDVGFLKVNTQEYRAFAADNNIHAIPCVLIFHNGQPAKFEMEDPRAGAPQITDRLIGLRPPEHYEMVIEGLLK
ncbi:MAG: thioredoxin family protein [Candidatus Thorarchaeota archaeon]